MKKLIFIIIAVSLFGHLATQERTETQSEREFMMKGQELLNSTDYCEGWKEGYCEGWKDVKGLYAICPITPICPIPELNKDRYRDGYNRGFKRGRKAANN